MAMSKQDGPFSLHRCPVCDTPAFEELGAHEICSICGWEDDPAQLRDHNFAGGANACSLNEARARHLMKQAPQWGGPGTRTHAEISAIHALRSARAIAHFVGVAAGKTPRLCPICGYEGPFSPVRHKPEIWCPGCDSRPRHRLLKLWVDRDMRLPAGARVVHFAAEPFARAWFEARGAEYLTADIDERHDLSLDIEAMALPDAALDVLIAVHVLEHVADDARALAELFRVLKPGGQAVIMVPMVEGWDATYEAPGLTEEERRLRYGDPLHRRFYGRDVRDRIRAAGFRLAEFAAVEPDVSRHALHRGERVFIGRKPI